MLCDPGEATASLWALSLESEGLEAGLPSPMLNTLLVWSSMVKRHVLYLSPILLSALPPSLPLFIHSFPPTPCLALRTAEGAASSNTGPAPGCRPGSRHSFDSQLQGKVELGTLSVAVSCGVPGPGRARLH